MTEIDACELLRRCLAGCQAEDWRALVDRYGREVRRALRLAANRCGLPLTEPDLDEIVQDFYCRLLTAQGRGFGGRTEEELWCYMTRVAQSLVVDRQRQLAAHKRGPGAHRATADLARLPSPKPDPEQRLLKKERRGVFFKRCFEVVRCDRVSLELRALTLALLEGWSSREIADELRGRLSADRVDKLVWLLRRRLSRDGIRMPRRYCVPICVPVM